MQDSTEINDSMVAILGLLLLGDSDVNTNIYKEIAEKHLDTDDLMSSVEVLEDRDILRYENRNNGKVWLSLQDHNS